MRSWLAFFVVGVALACSGASSAAVAGLSPEMEALLVRCAPNVHPETMAAAILAESTGNMFAIADAGPKNLPWSKRKAMVRSFYLPTLAEAVAKARSLIEAGHTVSIGLAQLNDRQLPRLGLTLEAAFDTCTNLHGGGVSLGECYDRASKQYGPGARALRAALSCYNSGDMERGEKDGYVDLVFQQRGRPLVLKTGAVPGKSRQVSSTGKANGRPWWKDAKARSFTMSSREFSVE